MIQKNPVTIVGAGLTGPMLSLFLTRRGFPVELFERRGDLRQGPVNGGRSINLAISCRGLAALEEVGLKEEILSQAVPMKGRLMHSPDGKLSFQPYGKNDSECIYSISRSQLNISLLNALEKEAGENLQMSFYQKALSVNLENKTVLLEDTRSGKKKFHPYHHLLGTDGPNSHIRESIMAAHQSSQFHLEDLQYGYKEFHIPPATDNKNKFQMEPHALHIWPRHSFMLIALPNFDGSFTCTLFLSQIKLQSLKTIEQVLSFFQKEFPDATPLITDLSKDFFENPTGHLKTIKCAPWSYKDHALLLGDACHAIVPFYGQGMNACFEDCLEFDRLLSQSLSWEEIFQQFELARKINSDAIADMALNNFIEMRDSTASAQFLLRKQVEKMLMERFPDKYLSQYNLVTFNRVPYSYAQSCGKIQEILLSQLCQNIKSVEELKEQQILEFLSSYQEAVKCLDNRDSSHRN